MRLEWQHVISGWRATAVSAVLLLPFVSVFRHPDVSWTFRTLMVATIAIAAAAPATGLLILTAALPLALALESLTGPPAATAITDCLIFAFVAGAAWRVSVPDRSVPDRLSRPALILGAIVAISAVARLGGRFAADSGEELWRHLTETYFFNFNAQRFGEVNLAVRWIAHLLLAVFIERILRRTPEFRSSVVRMWLIGSAAAASFAVLRITEVTLTRRVDLDPWASLVQLWERVRITALHTDFNAAGSYFALFLTAVLVLGLVYRRVWLLVGVAPPVLVAFAFTRSRAAFAGVVGAFAMTVLTRFFRRRILLALSAVLALAGMAGAIWIATQSGHISARAAVDMRVEMLKVGFAIITEHPVAGVGLGQFLPASRRFITEETPVLRQTYPTGENAHNNFLQIAAELGLPGLAAFVWLLAALWIRATPAPSAGAWSAERVAVSAGVAAFLVSALAGHPLLIPQVAAAFFLAVGLAAGLAPPPARRSGRQVTGTKRDQTPATN